MLWRQRLIWANVGAALVVMAYCVDMISAQWNEAQKPNTYLVLMEPTDPRWWNLKGPALPPNWEKQFQEDERLRSRERMDELYVGKVAHECGAQNQQMVFPFDSPSDVFLPLNSLRASVIVCIAQRAQRERIQLQIRSTHGESLPTGPGIVLGYPWPY